MRSNNSGATRFLLRRNLFIGVIVFLTTFFIMPFWGMSHIPNEKGSILAYQLEEQRDRALTELVSSSVMTSALNLEMMTVAYGGLGFLCAVMLMRHLFSRRQGMLQASLPDRREADFLRRLTAYAVLCLAPIVLNFFLYLLIVAANGLLAYVAWGKLLPRLGMLLLINLYGFAMGMLSSVLTGTFWAALLAGAVLIVGAEGMAVIWNYLAGQYLHTLVSKGFRQMLLHLSPAYSLYKGFYRPAEFVWLPGMLAIAGALGLSLVLCIVRKTEMTERTLAFGWLHTLMGFVLPLIGGSLMGVVMLMSFATEASLIAGLILGTVLTYWVCRMVFNQRFLGVVKQWYLPAAAAMVLMAGVAVLHTDALGFDSYLPERGEMTAVTFQPHSYHTDERVTLTSADALDAAWEWCTLMRDEVDARPHGLWTNDSTSSSVEIAYQVGKRTIYRRYPNQQVRTQAQPVLKRVLESQDYRSSLIDNWHLDDGSIETLYLHSRTSVLNSEELYEKFGMFPNYMNLERKKDGETIDLWMSALKEDILERTFEEKQQDAILNLQLTIHHPDGSYSYYSPSVYPGDEHFLRAVFGDRMEEIVAYATGGYAADLTVLKVTCGMSRAELLENQLDEADAVESITLAASPEEAVAWVKKAQSGSADRYYYMPESDSVSFSRLYLYDLSEVERYQGVYGYTIPEDPTQLYREKSIPVMSILDLVGE